jgi:hypothetical protein
MGFQTVSTKLSAEKKTNKGVSLYQKKSNGNGIKAIPTVSSHTLIMD